jgi:polyisoprenoid-binding protein YceI
MRSASVSTTSEQIAGTYTLDKIHSTAGFAVKHMVVSTFRGQFGDFDVTLTDGRFEGTVHVDSIELKDENLAAHVKSPDFFDSARYPEIRFSSSALERDGDDVVLRGELTIKDQTHPVEARGTISGPHEDIAGNTKIGLSLETVVDRTQFGLNWNAPLPRGGFAVANDVKLTVDLELARAEG